MKIQSMIQILKKYKMRSFYSQLILIVVALTVVLTAVSVIILFLLRNSMIEREKEIQKMNLNYAIEQLDIVIGNAYSASYSVIGDSKLVKGLFGHDRKIKSYIEDKDISDIISKLNLVYHADENIKNLFIVHHKYDYVVDQNGITDRELYFKGLFKKNVDFEEGLIDESHKFTLRMNKDNSSMYVLHTIYLDNKKFATLCMELDMTKLHDRETFCDFVEKRIVCVIDADDRIIGYLSDEQNDELVHMVIGQKNVKEYLVLSGSTSSKELQIIALTPLRMVTRDISVFFTISLSVFAFTVIIGITAAIWIAGRIYQPLYNAVELIVTAGNRSGENEFAIIENNVDEILAHNHTINTFMSRSAPIVLENLFRRLINEVGHDNRFEELLDMLSINLKDGYYMAVVIYEGTYSEGDQYSESADEMNRRLEEVINRYLKQNVISMFQRHKKEYILIIYLQQSEKRSYVLEQCKEMLKFSELIIAAGKHYKDVFSIGISYRDAIEVLERRSVSVSDMMVYDAEEHYQLINYELPGNIESVLYQHMLAGNSSLLVETIQKFLDYNMKKGVSFCEYLRLIGIFESYIIRMYENLEVDERDKLKLQTSKDIVYGVHMADKRIEVMLQNYVQIADYYQNKQSSEVVDKIVQFIEDNIEKDIGLVDIAEAVNLTPNYITKYFKTKNGMNFKAYLTMRRIEKAKQLLENTELTVKDIAERCGYNSSKQLIANFTKEMSITPGEYRKRSKS